jgi:hypothetical protein
VVEAVAALPQDAAANDRASKAAQSPVSHLILLGNRFCIVSPRFILSRKLSRIRSFTL